MNLIEITLAGFRRMVPQSLLSSYKSFGWERVEEQPQALKPEEVPAKKKTRKIKDSGAIVARAPKGQAK